MYYTYILQSLKDNQFYAGFTKNLKLRFEHHSKGRIESTRQRRPLKLIYDEACLYIEDAIRREKYFKTYHEIVSEKKAQILFNRVKSKRSSK